MMQNSALDTTRDGYYSDQLIIKIAPRKPEQRNFVDLLNRNEDGRRMELGNAQRKDVDVETERQ